MLLFVGFLRRFSKLVTVLLGDPKICCPPATVELSVRPVDTKSFQMLSDASRRFLKLVNMHLGGFQRHRSTAAVDLTVYSDGHAVHSRMRASMSRPTIFTF